MRFCHDILGTGNGARQDEPLSPEKVVLLPLFGVEEKVQAVLAGKRSMSSKFLGSLK